MHTITQCKPAERREILEEILYAKEDELLERLEVLRRKFGSGPVDDILMALVGSVVVIDDVMAKTAHHFSPAADTLEAAISELQRRAAEGNAYAAGLLALFDQFRLNGKSLPEWEEIEEIATALVERKKAAEH